MAQSPVTGEGHRPAFLPDSAPSRPPAGDTPTPPPASIITQIEIPTPPPTAEPLEFPGSSHSASTRQSDLTFLEETGPRQETSATTLSTHHPTPTVPVPVPAQAQARPSVAAGTPPPPPISDSPAVIYETGQQGLPVKPVAPEIPVGPDPGQLLKQGRYQEVEPIALETHDSRLASSLGWAYYQRRKNQAAYQWFERAIQWDEANYEAAYGLALVLFRTGDNERAAEVARWRVDQYPRMRRVLEDIATRKAVASFQSKNYSGAISQLTEMSRRRSLSREEAIMLAWARFHSGQVTQAKADFLHLYQQRADRPAADGVYTTYATTRDWVALRELAAGRGGPLLAIYQSHVSDQYYAHGLYRKALSEAGGGRSGRGGRGDGKGGGGGVGGQYVELEGIDSPAVGMEVMGRARSGTSGTSELTEYGAKLHGTFFSNQLHRFDLSVSLLDLNSGSLSRDTPIGKVPEDESTAYRHNPETRYSGIWEARVRWEREDLLTPSVELGISPAGGAVNPTFVGALGLRKVEDWGNWTAQIYRDPVRDSLLSLTGLRDPYSGEAWGRVTETGARFSLYSQLQDEWSFYTAASAGMRMGKSVRQNAHVALALAANKGLNLAPFEYFVLGPSLSLEFYDKNQSGFTYGHGGYFSPSHLIQAMVSARFLTHQGRNSLVRGNVGLGIQNNRQESVPWFPNKPDDRWITGQTTTGAALEFNVEGLYQLSPQWVLGGGLNFNLAPNYNDFSLRLSLRYFFEPRNGLFVQDFLTF